MTGPTQFTVRRAEAAYKTAEDQRRRIEAQEEADRLAKHARSQQQAQEAQRALSSPHRSLREALEWFADEWRASFPARLHEAFSVEADAVLGSPAWTERWKTWMTANDPAKDSDAPPTYEPIRRAHMAMTMSESLFDRCGAAYLFRLACLGFDPIAAGRNMDTPLGVEYVAWYTEKAIARLRERMDKERQKAPGRVDRPEWMERLHIGKSEAQHEAEAA